MSNAVFTTVSPVDGRVLLERPWAGPGEIEATLARVHAAGPAWRARDVDSRVALLHRMVDQVVSEADEAAMELTLQMGRPIRDSPGELRGFAERARTMLDLAPEALGPVVPPPKAGFTRYIQRVPHGLVLVLSPWNYPWLTAVNAIVPALAAGNTVLLKHSEQTPLVAERLVAAAREAGLPPGVFEMLHMDHAEVSRVVADERVAFVAFTGSVEGGRAVSQAASRRFIGLNLELGGKDPAYVRADADLGHAVPNIVEGLSYNAGQSCCGVERIYVHRSLFDAFVEAAADELSGLVLGNPTDPATTLGPVVRTRNAQQIRAQVEAAIAQGARGLIDPAGFPAATPDGPYVAPQLLTGVDHTMALMREETFGPVCGVMAVDDDAHAVHLMNDSRFGLTASLWTADVAAAQEIGRQLHTGTVFMNRCDALDPELAWVGVGDSGRGCSLSQVGYEALTRPKSFHLRLRT